MFRRSRKAEVSWGKHIAIMTFSVIFVMTWYLTLVKSQTVFIDERKIDTQLLIKQALDGRCFSNDYGLIIEERFTRDNVDECFKALPDSLFFKINVDSITHLFPEDETEFNRLSNKCVLDSSNLCTEMKFPIRYLDSQGERMEILTLQIISTV